MTPALVTLTTDFGAQSPYVAAMKGVILSIAPQVRLVDLTHGIAPQDIRQAALALADTVPLFPKGSIHVAVIDPGVGTQRRIVCANIEGRYLIAPDNGLLSLLAEQAPPQQIVSATEPRFWRPQVSATFHGRDIMAPLAGHLAQGVPLHALGDSLASLVMLDWPRPDVGPRRITGEVLSIDSFGNLITNITADVLTRGGIGLAGARGNDPNDRALEIEDDAGSQSTPGAKIRVHTGRGRVAPLVRTYGQSPDGSLVALCGSNGRLELAIVSGNAAVELQVNVGHPVKVVW